MGEAHVYEDLANIVKNHPVWPGDTISHKTANECVSRGWAQRDHKGYFIPTASGVTALEEWLSDD